MSTELKLFKTLYGTAPFPVSREIPDLTTFAKYNRSKRFLSPYAMLPNVSNIDIAKSKRPTHELIVAAY
jgi:hypothetical protein